MSRRASLPGADELFRVTDPGGRAAAPSDAPPSGTAAREDQDEEHERRAGGVHAGDVLHPVDGLRPSATAAERGAESPVGTASGGGAAPSRPTAGEPRRRVAVTRRTGRDREDVERGSTGRERHEEKITVYVSSEELFDLEHARLVLRGEHGIAADRGRIVREAIAVVLADLEAKGAQSILVRRLSQR